MGPLHPTAETTVNTSRSAELDVMRPTSKTLTTLLFASLLVGAGAAAQEAAKGKPKPDPAKAATAPAKPKNPPAAAKAAAAAATAPATETKPVSTLPPTPV